MEGAERCFCGLTCGACWRVDPWTGSPTSTLPELGPRPVALLSGLPPSLSRFHPSLVSSSLARRHGYAGAHPTCSVLGPRDGGDRVGASGSKPLGTRTREGTSNWETEKGDCSAGTHQPCIVCGFVSTTELQTFFPCTAVDEQNAQTQEQERLVLGLSESEEKKDLKSDDRMCHSESCGVAKCRSLRKGTSRWGDPWCCPGAHVMCRKLAEGGFRALSHHGCGPLAV